MTRYRILQPFATASRRFRPGDPDVDAAALEGRDPAALVAAGILAAPDGDGAPKKSRKS